MADREIQKVVLVRMGEITLKGLNRGKFEKRLTDNIKRRLEPIGNFQVVQTHSRIWVVPENEKTDDQLLHEVIEHLTKIFGIVSVSLAWRFSGDMDVLEQHSLDYMRLLLADGKKRTFKVESRRGDKKFPLTSPQISDKIGSTIKKTFPDQLEVKMNKPELIFHIEVRDRFYIYSGVSKGQKGLPVGISGKGMLLLSGGIDSPVAGYMMASRGLELEAVYFHAFPFTSDRAKEKVIELARKMTVYCGRIKLHIVNFTDIQVALRDHGPEDLLTIMIRRMMMRIADRLADRRDCKALITGESLGQVASQTLEALCCTDSIADKPVFRPLIGLDKDSTISIARDIDTFETSILPYEDCCTIFVAKHPKTHPSCSELEEAEQDIDIESMVNQGLDQIEEVIL